MSNLCHHHHFSLVNVRLSFLVRIVNLLSRRPFLSPENAKQVWLWKVRRNRRRRQKTYITRGPARERVLIAKMEQNLEKGESIQVATIELEHFLLGPEDADISNRSFAEKTREGGAGQCCSTHLEAKEQVEALKWQMQRVFAEAAEEGRRREEGSAA